MVSREGFSLFSINVSRCGLSVKAMRSLFFVLSWVFFYVIGSWGDVGGKKNALALGENTSNSYVKYLIYAIARCHLRP